VYQNALSKMFPKCHFEGRKVVGEGRKKVKLPFCIPRIPFSLLSSLPSYKEEDANSLSLLSTWVET